MRGLAVLVMLQGHVLDSWVRLKDRSSEWFWFSQFLGGYPAPIFLFLVGVSLALVLDRMRVKGALSRELAGRVFRRGGWILFLAYAFRLEQFLVWYPDSRWSDVFKVDTLNCIAACTILIGLLSIVCKSRARNIVVMASATGTFVLLTPWVFMIKGLPPAILSYVNGDQHPGYFSIFPWASFMLAGITFGYLLVDARERLAEREFFERVAVAGICAYAVGGAMSLSPVFEYGFFDYSLTSPHFFLVRLGCLLIMFYGAYLWSSRAGAGRWSPLVVLGQASLIVYWAHMELVYGRLLRNLGQSLDLLTAAMHLLWLVPLMIALASARRVQAAIAVMPWKMLPATAACESANGKIYFIK
jgi:uncharacterized membrane protein